MAKDMPDLNQRLNYSNLEVSLMAILERICFSGNASREVFMAWEEDFPYNKLKKPQQKELKEKLKSIPAELLDASCKRSIWQPGHISRIFPKTFFKVLVC